MPETKFKNDLRCTGTMAAEGGFIGDITGDLTGNVTGNVTGDLTGAVGGAVTGISKADDYALSANEKRLYIGAAMTAESKTLTLGLAVGQISIVHNEGATNAFTVKNVAGDTGSSLAAGKTLLVVGSPTANASVVIALD